MACHAFLRNQVCATPVGRNWCELQECFHFGSKVFRKHVFFGKTSWILESLDWRSYVTRDRNVVTTMKFPNNSRKLNFWKFRGNRWRTISHNDDYMEKNSSGMLILYDARGCQFSLCQWSRNPMRRICEWRLICIIWSSLAHWCSGTVSVNDCIVFELTSRQSTFCKSHVLFNFNVKLMVIQDPHLLKTTTTFTKLVLWCLLLKSPQLLRQRCGPWKRVFQYQNSNGSGWATKKAILCPTGWESQQVWTSLSHFLF